MILGLNCGSKSTKKGIQYHLRYFLEIAYKGTNYHGWQIQPNAITVQEVVNKAISTILQVQIETIGCGRTDTGVHASQFYLHFDSDQKLSSDRFINNMNGVLPDDIAAISLHHVKDDAHTRFDATLRGYVYKIKHNNTPFEAGEYSLFKQHLDIDKMNEAAHVLLKHTDFESLSKVHTEVKTFNCKITRAEWIPTDNGLNFHIEADRFLRGMVRTIVGTLQQVGLGKMTVQEFENIILAKDRQQAGASAPARGLFLCRVEYPNSIFENSMV